MEQNTAVPTPIKRILLIALMLGLICLIACQPVSSETPTSVALSEISTARATAVPTEKPQPTTTPSPPPILPAEEPTAEPTFTPQPTPTSPPTPSPWLIDRSQPFLFFGSNSGIQVSYLDGQVQLVAEGTIDPNGYPWSPDGSKFIYWEAEGPPYTINLYMADLLTGEVELLDFAHTTSYFWSPDGRYLLYAEDGNDFDIQVMVYDFESGENTILATFSRNSRGVYYRLAGWSPDSRKIAYVAQFEGQFDLFIIDVETHNIQQITDDPAAEVHVAWSPVENKLLVATNSNLDPFITYPFGAQELYLIDENGNGKRRLAEFEYLAQLSWSPDGQQVAFSDNGRLCLLNIADLSHICPLEEFFPAGEVTVSFNTPPAWSQDGQWFAFQIVFGPLLCTHVYLMNFSTNQLVQPEVNECGAFDFHWSPVAP